MMYLSSTNSQLWFLVKSVGFGFLLGFFFDLFRLLRLMTSGRKGFFLWDLLFGLFAGILVFLYDLVTDTGGIRIYGELSKVGGFLLWYLLPGRVSRRFTAKVESVIITIKKKAEKPRQMLCAQREKRKQKLQIKLKKFAKKPKFLLNLYRKMVYNRKE